MCPAQISAALCRAVSYLQRRRELFQSESNRWQFPVSVALEPFTAGSRQPR